MSVTKISRKMPENDRRPSSLSFRYVPQTKGCLKKTDTHTHLHNTTIVVCFTHKESNNRSERFIYSMLKRTRRNNDMGVVKFLRADIIRT
jgi:hypothetical protein